MERSRAVKTLLIVEDDNNQRFLYEKELTEDGYRVLLAGNGKEAVNIVEEENLDLVVWISECRGWMV